MKDSDNLPRAIECYKSALEINPKFAQALNNIAVVYTIQGKVTSRFIFYIFFVCVFSLSALSLYPSPFFLFLTHTHTYARTHLLP
jgi:hypothetical protein